MRNSEKKLSSSMDSFRNVDKIDYITEESKISPSRHCLDTRHFHKWTFHIQLKIPSFWLNQTRQQSDIGIYEQFSPLKGKISLNK